MKRVLSGLAAAIVAAAGISGASAADIGAAAPIPTPHWQHSAAPADWSGCYAGVNVGGGTAHKQWNYGYYNGIDYDEDYGSHNATGFLAGGQIGCNLQADSWVFGIEGDLMWTPWKGDHELSGYYHSTRLVWTALATGRIGYAFDQTLLYAKGGLAWDSGDYGMVESGYQHWDKGVVRTGWTIGGGVEHKLGGNWSAKLEYNYVNFGWGDVWWDYLGDPSDPWSYHIKQDMHIVKVGLNYRFGGHTQSPISVGY